MSLSRCVWPDCTRDPVTGLPLCAWHATETWDKVEAWKDRAPLTRYKLNRRLEAKRREDAARESRSITPGWIYYVRVTDRIKVGYSADVKRRMRAYPPHAELLAVHPGTPAMEREIHTQFADSLAQGREWFSTDEVLMAHVDTVLEQFGPPPKRMIYTFRTPKHPSRATRSARRA